MILLAFKAIWGREREKEREREREREGERERESINKSFISLRP